MDDLGDRIKRYEKVYNHTLTPRSCLFIRVDGKSFHTYTRHCEKPFDDSIITAMQEAAAGTISQMSGFRGAYIQSDECTFMLTDFSNLNTQGWFNYELNKVVSITASAFTAYFNDAILNTPLAEREMLPPALFDARAFVVPQADAANVFIWRQRDWERNSVQMMARALYPAKELEYKKMPDLHEMIHVKDQNWALLANVYKNGTYIFADEPDFIHQKLTYDSLNEYLFNEKPNLETILI